MDACKLQDGGLKLGSGVDGQQLTATLCSNWDAKKHRSCRRLGTKFCSRCRLVSYCSKECQKEDWEKHKEACKSEFMNEKYVPSWVNSGRLPSWVTSDSATTAGEALYGNMPAHGVLGGDERLPSNPKFCFAAGSDLRNVFATICQLPDSFRGRLSLYINDGNPRVVARHFLILELLRVYGYDAIDAAIAVWYSSCLTSEQSRAIDQVVSAVKSSADLRHAREYASSKSSLVASFGKEVWDALQEMRSSNWTRKSALESRRAVMLSRPDLVDRKLACLKPQHRVAWYEYRKSGMLLPFDHVFKGEHGCPNKYILHPVFGWTISDASEPLDGWDMKDVVAAALKHGVSEKNLYGCLFFYLREQLRVVLEKLQVCQIRLYLYCEDARDLSPMLLKEGTRLHRVDTSNLADSFYVGIERILEDWGPLLQRKGQFKAVLITSHMNWHALGEADGIFENLSFKELEAAMRLCSQRKDKNCCAELYKEGFSNGDLSMMRLFHDFSSKFSKYLKLQKAYEAGKHAGLVAREQHQVVARRIGAGICDQDKCFPGMTASIEELYYHTMLHNHTLTERWMEWVPVSET